MNLTWPASVKFVLTALSMDMLQLPNAACFLVDSASALSPFWVYATAYCAAMLGLLVAIPLVQTILDRGEVGHGATRARTTDHVEFALTIIYTVQLTTTWRVQWRMVPTQGSSHSARPPHTVPTARAPHTLPAPRT